MSNERDTMNHVRVAMTLTEEARAVNPIGGPNFKYWSHATSLEDALRNIKLHMKGICDASFDIVRVSLIGKPSRELNFRALQESDFVLRPEVFHSYDDQGREVWISMEAPISIEGEERELVGNTAR